MSIKNRLFPVLGFSPFRHVSLEASTKPFGVYERLHEIQKASSIEIQRLFGNPSSDVHLGTKRLYSVEGAVVYSRSSLLALGGNLVRESTLWNPELSLFSFGNPPKEARSSASGLFVRLPSASFYHFMFESLPQLLWIRDKYPDVTLVLHKKSNPYEHEVAAHLGMRILYFNRPMRLERTLLIGQPGALGIPSDFETHQLRKMWSSNSPKVGNRMLFVSRRFATRSAGDDRLVEDAAQSLGFETVHFEKMSLMDQIELSSEATTMVGLHGAGLSNAVFMPPGSHLVEVLDRSWPNHCFEIMARHSQLNFSRVISDSIKPDAAIMKALRLAKALLAT